MNTILQVHIILLTNVYWNNRFTTGMTGVLTL